MRKFGFLVYSSWAMNTQLVFFDLRNVGIVCTELRWWRPYVCMQSHFVGFGSAGCSCPPHKLSAVLVAEVLIQWGCLLLSIHAP